MNQKRILCSLVCFIMVVSLVIPVSSGVVRASTATEIWDWHDLDAVRDNLSGSYVLMTDLDSTTAGYEELAGPTANADKGWQPIGTDANQFTGSFDGQGHEIGDLCINRPDEDYVGLFGFAFYGAFVENLGLANVHVIGGLYVGGLVGTNYAGVSELHCAGHVVGNSVVGGLVGQNFGSVLHAHFLGNVTGDSSSGGLVGVNGADSTVNRSHSNGSVVGKSYIGGLVGNNYGSVSESHCAGNVVGWDLVGGLIGKNFGNVANSYSTGSVTRSEYTGSWLGGFVGRNEQGKIINCYSTGSVHYEGEADPTDKGFAGSVDTGGDYEMTGNFWDIETSGQSSTVGDATGKTTAEMMGIATFTAAGWNITAVADGESDHTFIWNIVDGETYPFLAWEATALMTIHVHLKAGWNLVSVPVIPADPSVAAVFPGTEVVYAWSASTGGYYMPAEVEPSRGYWVAVVADTDIKVSGVPVYDWTAEVTAGWNLVGSVFGSVDFTEPDTEPSGTVEGFSYRWAPELPGYSLSTTIEPGMGHWIAATEDCVLTLSAGDELVLWPTTVVVDEETEDVLTSVTEDQDVLTFGASTPLLNELEPGNVIVMGATDHTPYGLLRRVTAITNNDGQVIVETEFASMEDAIAEGMIAVATTITAADFQAATLGLEGITVLQEPDGIGFTIDLDATIGDFTFTGELAFNADPLIKVDITYWPPGLKELEFTIETDESLEVDLWAEVDVVDFCERLELLPHPIEKHIFIPKPPVYVVIYFMPVLIVEGNLSGQVQARVEYEAQRKGGLHYKDDGWNIISEQYSQFNGWAELAVQTNLRASVGPEVAVKFYNVVGPTGNMYGYLEFEAGWDAHLWWELYGGLRAELGLQADLPIVGGIGYGPVEVMHYRWLLAEYQSDEEPVHFPDPNLEAAIREAITKPTGDIYPSDLEGIMALDARDRNIEDLAGLDYCTGLTELYLQSNQISDISPLEGLSNLTVLWLHDNQISDISPLAGLTSLTYLSIWSNQISDISALAGLTSLTILYSWSNQISDISPLAGLTSLTRLYLGNQISDISALAGLTNLTWLVLSDNQISDISPLANLTSLPYLHLNHNQIGDISALAGLTSLTQLSLSDNQISDIRPLVDNGGLGAGDKIWLSGNPLSEQSINDYIPELEARGVTVYC